MIKNQTAASSANWLKECLVGRFEAIPDPLLWNDSVEFAHLMPGYEVAQSLGISALGDFANAKHALAEATGRWVGTSLELWLCLFFEHRSARHGGGSEAYAKGPHPLLDALCKDLRDELQRLSPEEAAVIAAWLA